MPLSDVAVRNAKGRPRAYKLSDGEGLYLLVKPDGARYWRFDYRHLEKRKTLAVGVYPAVGLAAARVCRDDARKLLAKGIDPGEDKKRRAREAKIAAAHTFEAVALEWFEGQRGAWVDSYASRLRSRLDADLLPPLGRRPIADIEPGEVLDAVRKVEARGAGEMARRVLQMASSIFRYGVATSRCRRDPTADLRGALKAKRTVKHRAALKADELPSFFAALRGYDGEPLTALAVQLVVHTFVRTEEARAAAWAEFSLDGKEPVWRIPAERMKMRRDHLVPLSHQAVAILRALAPHSGRSQSLFPGKTKRGVISENTMLYALYRMGYHGRATIHGFRSTASTVLNEHGWNRDWIEMQLAHVEGNVRGVYNAAEYLPGRRTMMQWWSDFLDRQALDDEARDLLG